MASATDIITYIGVPLAVLGVLPILYNTAATLLAVSRIRRMLSHSGTTAAALTRSDVVNRVIEVELPRYAVAPWGRAGPDRHQYWSLASRPSAIPGGSWTIFNWRSRIVGFRTLRVEYADQLRQPQSEVAFDDLVCYLLDLGAVPDPPGWRLLRSTGLWTPVGCTLMTSPDGAHRVLAVAPLHDSDGYLSLAVTWMPEWTTRDHSTLPPYWARLPRAVAAGRAESASAEKNAEHPGQDGELSPTEMASNEEGAEKPQSLSPPPPLPSSPPSPPPPQSSPQSPQSPTSGPEAERVPDPPSETPRNSDTTTTTTTTTTNTTTVAEISCHVTAHGLEEAFPESAPAQQQPQQAAASPLYVEHLRISAAHAGTSDGVWFASAVTAYGTTSSTLLWSYKIPDHVLAFARTETVPCGALVLLGLVDEAVAPEWATTYDDGHANLERFARRSREQRMAIEAEARLPPAQRAQAQQDRVRRENMDRIDEVRDRMRTESQRRETRALEALRSPRWAARAVAPHALAFLQGQCGGGALLPAGERPLPVYLPLRDAAGQLLRGMVLDTGLARAVCVALDGWRAWADNGGMRKTDLDALGRDPVAFARAAVLLAVVAESAADHGGGGQGGASRLCVDMQECLSVWKTVRLG